MNGNSEMIRDPGAIPQRGTARTAETVGAEIRNLTEAAKYLTVYYAVEIGRRLSEAKEMVAHGEWMEWLKKETEFSQSGANRLMRIYTEYGQKMGLGIAPAGNSSTLNNLSVSNALRLLAVPEEERESFAEEVGAEHISARELEAAIRDRDEAKRKLEELQFDYTTLNEEADDFKDRAEAAEARVKELEARPVDVAVQEPDPEEVERRAEEIAKQAAEAARKEIEAVRKEKSAQESRMRALEAEAKAEQQALKERLAEAEAKLKDAGTQDAAAAEAAREEAAALKKQLAMSGEATVVFKLRFQLWQEAFADVMQALRALPGETREKCAGAVRTQLENWKTAAAAGEDGKGEST